VPCETCVLSAADMIFTRLGAVDRIMSGESKSHDGMRNLHFDLLDDAF